MITFCSSEGGPCPVTAPSTPLPVCGRSCPPSRPGPIPGGGSAAGNSGGGEEDGKRAVEARNTFSATEIRRAGPVLLVKLTGRLVMGEGERKLDEFLQGLIARGERALLLDCAEVPAIDSQGIKSLARAVVSLQNKGGVLKLLALTPRVRMVLDVTRLLGVIEVFDDEEAALRSF